MSSKNTISDDLSSTKEFYQMHSELTESAYEYIFGKIPRYNAEPNTREGYNERLNALVAGAKYMVFDLEATKRQNGALLRKSINLTGKLTKIKAVCRSLLDTVKRDHEGNELEEEINE